MQAAARSAAAAVEQALPELNLLLVAFMTMFPFFPWPHVWAVKPPLKRAKCARWISQPVLRRRTGRPRMRTTPARRDDGGGREGRGGEQPEWTDTPLVASKAPMS